jgi:RimJ/RimL family protein N-acetyltransferase
MNALLPNDPAIPGLAVRLARSPADPLVIGARPTGYPAELEIDALLADGGLVRVRPIRPDDAKAHRAFFAHQSEQSRYFRFFGHRSALTDREVTHFTTVDYHDRMAFVAFLNKDLVGVGRYDRLGGCDAAEVAFAVADEHQGRGLATMLLEHLAAYAATTGIARFSAETMIDNRRMLDVFQRAGFRRESGSIEYGVVQLSFDMAPPEGPGGSSTRPRGLGAGRGTARRLPPDGSAG